MTGLVDAEAQRRVTQLIEKITDKRKFSVEPDLAKDVKRLCRSSDSNISAAFDALFEQLKSSHAQVRPLPSLGFKHVVYVALHSASSLSAPGTSWEQPAVYRVPAEVHAQLLAPEVPHLRGVNCGVTAGAEPAPGPGAHRRAVHAVQALPVSAGSSVHRISGVHGGLPPREATAAASGCSSGLAHQGTGGSGALG